MGLACPGGWREFSAWSIEYIYDDLNVTLFVEVELMDGERHSNGDLVPDIFTGCRWPVLDLAHSLFRSSAFQHGREC